MLFKDISNLELWQRFCSAELNHFSVLVEGIKRNNSVKKNWIWTSGSGDVD